MSDDPRKAYWSNQYVDYWRARVEEAGVGESDVVKGDSRTEDDSVYQAIFAKWPLRPGNVVDIGCAWGRMFPMLLEAGLEVSGLDISAPMIEQARKEWSARPGVAALHDASAEQTPFSDEQFDNLICLAVFDATYQDRAMTEFLRITRPGARLYVTGKNTDYPLDDEEAYRAEIGARGKGHPNYFTRTTKLIEALEADGHRVLTRYLFERRGDFAAFSHGDDLDAPFYEYLLVIERGPEASQLEPISDEYSRTFERRTGEAG